MKREKKIFSAAKKHASLSFLLCVVLSIMSCQNEKQEGNNNPATEEYLEFRALYLSKYGIPAILMIPDETAKIGATTEPEIIHEEGDFLWTIKAGPNFTMRIEDFGDYGNRLNDKKRELAEQNKFTIRYIVNDSNLIVYEQKLIVNGLKNAPQSVGVEHVSSHVCAQVKIDGVFYELRSPDKGYSKYQRRVIDLLAKSMRSFKSIH